MPIPITLVADGFGSLEGPVVDEPGNLWVADLRAGGVHRIGTDGSVTVTLPERTHVGGIVRHVAGGLVVSGPTVAHAVDGELRTLLELDGIAGFNDLAATSAGQVLAGVLRVGADGAPVPGALVLITAPGRHVVLHDDVHPNGMAFSPDADRLYLADTFRRRLLVLGADWDVVGVVDTTPVPGLPDGVATDEEGGVWVAFYRGGCVARFSADGRLLHVVDVPAPKPLSLCFQGTDLLVVTGRSEPGAADTGAVYRLSVSLRGAPVALATI